MRLHAFVGTAVLGLVSFAAAGCTGGTADPGGSDGGSGTDAGMQRGDVGVVPVDGGAPAVDTGVVPTDDAGSTGDDAATTSNDAAVVLPDGALVCVAGVECTGYSAALALAARGAAGDTPAAALANCVIQLHRSDCCGATDANAINHGSRSDLCAAEASCSAQYPQSPGCTDTTITTDTGETTTNRDDVRLRVVSPTSCSFGTCYTCETFVCTDPSCRTAPGIAGGCG